MLVVGINLASVVSGEVGLTLFCNRSEALNSSEFGDPCQGVLTTPKVHPLFHPII